MSSPLFSRSLPAFVCVAGCLSVEVASAQRTFVEPLPPNEAQVIVGGVPIQGGVKLWTVENFGNGPAITDAELAQVIRTCKEVAAAHPQTQSFPPSPAAFDLQFTVNAPPPGAAAAIAAIETWFEARLASSHATQAIQITVNFAPLAPSTAMSTSTTLYNLTYSQIQSALTANMDADDVLQPFFPVGTLPVRFDSTSATVTNCANFYMAAATLVGVVPSVVGVTGANSTITVNSSLSFDYDPSNGTGGLNCFQTAFAHEVGHALGFNSAVDLGGTIPTQLDFLRFQRTTGNPTTYAGFQTAARLVDFDSPNDDHELDLLFWHYAMEDGNPQQSGHFREQTPEIGTMDPILNQGDTFYPNFMHLSDMRVLDALGFDWDDPSLVGLAHLPTITKLDEDPNSSTSVRWRLAFDKRVGPVVPGNCSVAGIAGASVTSVGPIAGNAVRLDGTNWIDLQGYAPITNIGAAAFTLSCWFRPTIQAPSGAPRRQILSIGTTTVGQGINVYLDSNNKPQIEISGLLFIWPSSPVVNDGNWHHVAVTRTAGSIGTLALLVDGASAGTNLTTVSLNGGSCMAGRSVNGTASVFGFIGDLDEVRFYDAVVGTTYSNLALPASTANLIGNFPFDELANFGFGGAALDTPQETFTGGFGEAATASVNAPTLVTGFVDSARNFTLTAATGAGSGLLTPTFTESDNVLEFRSGAPLEGPGVTQVNGPAYTIQHASGSTFCEGLVCPCSNNASQGTNVGCLHSGSLGARLRGSGSTSIAAGNAVLLGSQMVLNSPALYFRGTAPTSITFGDGILCAGTGIVRMGVKFNVGDASQYPGAGDPTLAAASLATAGQAMTFQVWYRDSAAFCTTATYNLTNGWAFTWTN